MTYARKVLILCALIAFLTDQASKAYITHILNMKPGEVIHVIDPILNWQYVRNYGVNFGFLSQSGNASRWLLIGLTAMIVLGILLWVHGKLITRTGVFVGLVVGGAIGNIFDRIVYGSVTDFINNSWFNFHNPFSYNLADIWIFFGIIGLIFWGPEET